MYVQIADSIADQIRSDRLGVGNRLPPERELAEQLHVSRMTVRQALALLAQQGLISSRHGVGNFVTRPMLEQPVDVLIGFSDNLVRKGVKPGARLLEVQAKAADRHLAAALQVRPGAAVLAIHRLRLADDTPVALEQSYFPEQLMPGLLHHDLESRSIYAVLAEEYGIRLDGARQTLEPVVALSSEAALLQIATGAPLMLVTRTSTDTRQRVVEYAKDRYRGDCFRFVSQARSPVV